MPSLSAVVALGLIPAIALAAEPESPAPAPDGALRNAYTAAEIPRLSYCMALTSHAHVIALYRSAGRSVDDVKAAYADKPQAEVVLPLVDKVYADAPANPWDYAVSFFAECGEHIASVPAARIGLASYCLQNTLITGTAWDDKAANVPRERALARFEKMGKTPGLLVNRVYDSSDTRAQATGTIWSTCITPAEGP